MTVDDLPTWLKVRGIQATTDEDELRSKIEQWYRERYPWMHEHSVRTKARRLTVYFRHIGKIQ